MPSLTFYRQGRRDGGTRTAIELDGETDVGFFEGSDDEDDPVLTWYVDVRCNGRKVPSAPALARRWLFDNSEVIQAGLRSVAEELSVGLDMGPIPLLRPVAGSPRGLKIEIVCFFGFRTDGLAAARILSDLANHWQQILKRLTALADGRRQRASM